MLAGLALAGTLMVFIIPALDLVDEFQLKHPYAPLVMIVVTVAAALMYPRIDEWSTCRGDTMLILGSYLTVSSSTALPVSLESVSPLRFR